MDEQLRERFRGGRPLAFTGEEAAHLREALREAMGVVLQRDAADVRDDARVFDELGLDSVDVFDLLDQLAERFDVAVNLEELPPEMIQGRPETTFSDFADGLLAYFATEPPPATGEEPAA